MLPSNLNCGSIGKQKVSRFARQSQPSLETKNMGRSPAPTSSVPPLHSTSAETIERKNRCRSLLHTLLVAARAVYLVLTGTAIFLFFTNLPVYYAQLEIVCPGMPSCAFFGQLSQGTLPWFKQAHISVAAYAAALLALVSLNALLALIFGTAIVWRLWGKDNELLGLLTSFVLIGAGTLSTKGGDFVGALPPSTPSVLLIIGIVGFALYWPAFATLIMTFPTGRFAP